MRALPLAALTGPADRDHDAPSSREASMNRDGSVVLAAHGASSEAKRPRTDIDESLSVRGDRLFVEGCDVIEVARRFGTPLFVVSENQLRRNARRICAAFEDRWTEGPVRVLASIKANFTLATRAVLTQEGIGCDVFGPGELEAAIRTGVDPSLVSVNGTAKDVALLERAIESGAKVTLDSMGEIRAARDIARRIGRRATVRFRLRPDYATLTQPSEFVEEDVPIAAFARTYKPGIPTMDLLEAGRQALSAEELDVSGVMAHLGRHHHDPAVWRGMAEAVVATLAELSQAWDGWMPREIDLGGGFASPRDPTGRALRRAADRPERGPGIEDYADAVTSALRDALEAKRLRRDGLALEVEPGRSMYADAGIHLATVRNVKREPGRDPERWIETDTTEMFLADLMIEHDVFPVIVASRAATAGGEPADVVGISCGFDVLATDLRLPDVRPSDVLAFLDTGAYQDATSSNFNAMPRPATVLVCDDAVELVKRAETVDDVFRRDVVPARLGGSGAQEASANARAVAPESGGSGAQEASANARAVAPESGGSRASEKGGDS
jgi:diaminopimelate decarboxylase